MPRGHVVVRAPRADDTDAVLEKWDELRSGSPRGGPLAPTASESELRRLLSEVAADDTYRAVVAEVDGRVVGMACFIARPMGPFVEAVVVQIDYDLVAVVIKCPCGWFEPADADGGSR